MHPFLCECAQTQALRYTYIYIYICVCLSVSLSVCLSACMHACMYVCAHIYIYIYIYINIYIYIYTYTNKRTNMNEQTNNQASKQTNTHTHTHRQTQTHTHTHTPGPAPCAHILLTGFSVQGSGFEFIPVGLSLEEQPRLANLSSQLRFFGCGCCTSATNEQENSIQFKPWIFRGSEFRVWSLGAGYDSEEAPAGGFG